MARSGNAPSAAPLPADVLVSYLAVTVLWGLNWPAMKIALASLDPWTFRSLVLVLATITLVAIARLQGRALMLPRRHRWAIVLPALSVTGWHVLSAYGLTHTTSGRAAIIAFTMPFWTMLLSIPVLGERPTRRRLAALALGLAGLALLLVDELEQLQAAPMGVIFMVGAAIAWAIGTVATKARDWAVSPLVLTAWQLGIGVLPILVVTALGGPRVDFADVAAASWIAVLYAAFVAMVFCYTAYIRFVTLLPATVAAIGVMAIPAVGLLGAGLLLGEPVGPIELGALALVVAGQSLVTFGVRR